MATKAPQVHFSEGEKTTARHLGYLEKQQALFESSVGKSTIDLYNSLMEVEGEMKLPIWFATGAGSGLGKVQHLIAPAPIAVANAGWQKWYLIPASGRESLDSFSGSAYWFQEIETGDYLGHVTTGGGYNTSRFVVKGHGLNVPVEWNWFIKPAAPGSDRFTIRQEDSPGWVIGVDKETKALGMKEPLPSPSAELFQILPLDQ